jgi:hypothetical protein
MTDINFTNAEEIEVSDLTNVLSLDFTSVDKEAVLPKEEETTEEPTDSLELSIESKKEEAVEEPQGIVDIINSLADSGLITEGYDGFNENEEPTPETLQKLIEHNVTLRINEEIQSFIGSLDERTQKIMEYNINSKGEGLEEYLRTLLEEHDIKALNPENEYDQEKILRTWYRSKEGYNQSEVDEKINELKEAGLLEKDAKRIKPKLDEEASKIAQSKEEEQKKIRDLERQVKSNYTNKVIDTLKDGKVNNIPLNKEELQQIFSILTNEETEVTVHGGKKIMMAPLDALIFFNKYDNRGSLENLALATLLLINPNKFKEVYQKEVKSEESKKFIADHKYTTKLTRDQDKPKAKEEKYVPWRLKPTN